MDCEMAGGHRLYGDLLSQSFQTSHKRIADALLNQAQPKADECKGNERRKSEDVPGVVDSRGEV